MWTCLSGNLVHQHFRDGDLKYDNSGIGYDLNGGISLEPLDICQVLLVLPTFFYFIVIRYNVQKHALSVEISYHKNLVFMRSNVLTF